MRHSRLIALMLIPVFSAAVAAERTAVDKTAAASAANAQLAKPETLANESQVSEVRTYTVSPVVKNAAVTDLVSNRPLPAAASEAVETQTMTGRTALEIKNYALARENFSAGVKTAREHGDVQTETRLLFLEAVANQGQGEARGDVTSLRNAAGLYQQVLERKPDSGSAMVNLAQVYNRLDDATAAERLYRQAIDLGDRNRPAYQTAYAGFLQSRGRNEDARRLYTNLLQTDPFNQTARQALADYYRGASADWGQLESYLWGLVDRGEVDQSTDLALDVLANRAPAQQSDEGLLLVIAAGLGRKVGLADGFLGSPTANKLRGFSGRANIGDGIRQLFAVYQALARLDESGGESAREYMEFSLSWWSDGYGEEGRTPLDVMRQLLNSLGGRYGQRQKYRVAEACFEKAASIVSYNPDPTSIRNLVNLYAEQGDMDKINEIANRYEFGLFESKGQAYRDSDFEKIYQYHRTLGQIYSYLAEKSGDWGSSGQSHSAIFQLEHAYGVGSRLDRMQGGEPGQQALHVDPGLVDRLAAAYAATGQYGRGNDLRLEAAKKYRDVGDLRASDFVLGPIDPATLTTGQMEKYRLLKSS